MARTRHVYRLKKNLSPPWMLRLLTLHPATNLNHLLVKPIPHLGVALNPPPRRDLTNDVVSELVVNPPTVPTSEPPANPPEERLFPSKENIPCATKTCPFNGTVYRFYHRAQKNANREKFYCLDCIDKFRSQSRARKKRSAQKSKKAKDFNKACQILGLPEVV